MSTWAELPVTINSVQLRGEFGDSFDWYVSTQQTNGIVYVLPPREDGVEPGEAAVALLTDFASLDENNNGLLSFAEAEPLLNTFFVSRTAASPQALFELLDANGDGSLSPGELRRHGGEGGVHAADQNGDGRIALSELLRIIQFYNSGAFGCAANGGATEDGYVPGAGDDTCTRHSSDYFGGATWRIELTELLRLIQFYNSGGYTYCPANATEDGYCPVR